VTAHGGRQKDPRHPGGVGVKVSESGATVIRGQGFRERGDCPPPRPAARKHPHPRVHLRGTREPGRTRAARTHARMHTCTHAHTCTCAHMHTRTTHTHAHNARQRAQRTPTRAHSHNARACAQGAPTRATHAHAHETAAGLDRVDSPRSRDLSQRCATRYARQRGLPAPGALEHRSLKLMRLGAVRGLTRALRLKRQRRQPGTRPPARAAPKGSGQCRKKP